MNARDFDHWVENSLTAFEATLDSLVPTAAPAGLGDAMRYASLAIRPVGSPSWSLVGTILRAHPGAPIYVDAAAAAPGAGLLLSMVIGTVFCSTSPPARRTVSRST